MERIGYLTDKGVALCSPCAETENGPVLPDLDEDCLYTDFGLRVIETTLQTNRCERCKRLLGGVK